MKRKPYLIFILIIFGCSPKNDFYIYPASKNIFETSEYTVEQIFEGPNKFVPVAVIISTNKRHSESKLIAIKKHVLVKNLTESHINRAPFVFKHSQQVYGVLFDYYTPEIRRDEFVEIDSLKHHVNIQFEKLDMENYEVLGLFAHLGHYETEGYKNVLGILAKNRESGEISFGRYKVDLINKKLMINTKYFEEVPFYEFELQMQESGDLGFYSHKNKGLHNYYLKIEN